MTKWKFRLTCINCKVHTKAPKSMNFLDTKSLRCNECDKIYEHYIRLMRFSSLASWWKPWTWLSGEWKLWTWKT